jgi:diguanylate cyclase (GGDEF)-like protein/PAS domain S-box-containing protein
MFNNMILKSKTVLYVEDDDNTREEIAFFLEKFVKTLIVAKNGQEGLDLYKKNFPDLIITDIQMPIMNGIEMSREIKILNKNIPIIITTAFNETDYLLNAINSGVDKYILKPVNLKIMLNDITELLEEHEYKPIYQSLNQYGFILDVNQGWLDFLGYERDEVIGHFFGDFVAINSLTEIEKNFPHFKDYGFVNNVHFQIKHKNGDKFEVILNGTSTYDENGELEKTHCELRTINFFKHSEKQITKMLKKERYLRGLITTHALISSTIAQTSSLDTFLQEVTNAFIENVEYEHAFISLFETKDKLKIISQSQNEKFDIVKITGEILNISDDTYYPTCEAVRSKRMVIIDDIAKLSNFPKYKILKSKNINAIVALPIKLKTKEHCYGILTLHFNKLHKFTKEELELFNNISETVAFGIQAIEDRLEKEHLLKELDKQATTDALTGCNNRHKGNDLGKKEVERSYRYNRPLSILYFDIDYFKSINDIYGHHQGDKTLIDIAKKTKKLIRTSDIAVRWGGEEFIVILPESDLEDATTIAEKLRSGFEKEIVMQDKGVTASFGVAQLQDKETWNDILKRADMFMYKAKECGRNRVINA